MAERERAVSDRLSYNSIALSIYSSSSVISEFKKAQNKKFCCSIIYPVTDITCTALRLLQTLFLLLTVTGMYFNQKYCIRIMVGKWGLPHTSLRLSGNILFQNFKTLNSEIYLALRVLDK